MAWIGGPLVAILIFRYRSAYYLLPLLPAMALFAAGSVSLVPRRAGPAVLALLAACCVWKVASASPVLGIPAGESTQQVLAPALERYCGLQRGNGLILVGSTDQFYASILPIPRVRYAMLEPQPPSPAIDYAWLGIWMPATQFIHLDQWLPLYRSRLESYQLHSDRPVGTVIWANSVSEIQSMIESHPESDFLVPSAWTGWLHLDSFLVSSGGAGRSFLLSKKLSSYSEARGCHL